jgi:diketogulonate reductase-like aldo/keto reductase
MPIPGTTSIAHVRENLDAPDIELSREDIQAINSSAPEWNGHSGPQLKKENKIKLNRGK